MVRRHLIAISLIAAFMLMAAGCGGPAARFAKNATMNFQSGNFDGAYFNAVASLRLDSTNPQMHAMIQDAYRAATSKHTETVKQLMNSGQQFKWDDIFKEYEVLVKINAEIGTLPTLANPETGQVVTLTAQDYSGNLAEAREKAAEAHYEAGLDLMDKGGVEDNKAAAKEFKIVMSYISDYEDAAELYEEARKAGIKRIAIIPFEDKSGKGDKYGVVAEMMVDQIVADVMNDKAAMEFLEIISRDQMEKILMEQDFGASGFVDPSTAAAMGKVLGVHEIIVGKITQIIYTPERKTDRTVDLKKTVVVRTEQYTDDKGKTRTRNINGQVSGKAKVFKRTSSASIMGSYQSIDVATAKVKNTDNLVAKADYVYEWATFQGDQRALDKTMSALTVKTEEFAPVEEEMVRRAVINLSNQLAATMKSYVK